MGSEGGDPWAAFSKGVVTQLFYHALHSCSHYPAPKNTSSPETKHSEHESPFQFEWRELKGKVFVPFVVGFRQHVHPQSFRLSCVFAAHTCICFHSHLQLYQRHPVRGAVVAREKDAQQWTCSVSGAEGREKRKRRRERKSWEACEGLALWHFMPLCLGWLLYWALQQAVTSQPIKSACLCSCCSCCCCWLSASGCFSLKSSHRHQLSFILYLI